MTTTERLAALDAEAEKLAAQFDTLEDGDALDDIAAALLAIDAERIPLHRERASINYA